MHLLSPLLLFIITIIGGSIPLWLRGLTDKRMQLLLAFSGAFLLGITFLHLLPETFRDFEDLIRDHAAHQHSVIGAGFYILGGFFLQLFIQRFTHGVEHGHVHVHPNTQDHSVPVWSIVAGLSLHAFMEGLPLGFNYRSAATGPSLYFAVAAHKLPEAMLLTMLVSAARGRSAAIKTLLLFSLLTPVAGILATYLGTQYGFISRAVSVLIPVVAGAFIHIATTIFFESGTKQHLLTAHKVLAMAVGVAVAMITLFLE